MKPHFSDPEHLSEERLARFDRLWRDRQIGDSTYLRSLFIDGIAADVATSRLNCLKMEQS